MWVGGNPTLDCDIVHRKLVINCLSIFLGDFLVLASATHLGRELNDEGHRTKQYMTKVVGAKFTKASLRRCILTNSVYMGKIQHKDKLFDGLMMRLSVRNHRIRFKKHLKKHPDITHHLLKQQCY